MRLARVCCVVYNYMMLLPRRAMISAMIPPRRMCKLYSLFLILALGAFLLVVISNTPPPLGRRNCDHTEDFYERKCEDDVFRFYCPKHQYSVFGDRDLYNSCTTTEKSTPLPRVTNPPTDIKVKCNSTNLILLSYEKKWKRKEKPGDYIVPNVVHYVLFGCYGEFTFLNYMSFFSVNKFVKPDYIILHGDCLPRGKWWQSTIKDVANLYSAYMKKPRIIQTVSPMWIEHASDIARLQIMYELGGIYLDTDILVIRPLEELRNHATTLGREATMLLNNGVILARPKAPFICIWMNAYRQYKPSFGHDWNTYSVKYPYLLSFVYKELIHIEEKRLVRPNMREADQSLFTGHFDWRHHYTIHVWKSSQFARIPKDEIDVMTNFLDCSLGDIMKFILFSGQ